MVNQRSKTTDPHGDGSRPRVVILGGGPAGLTAAYELVRAGVPCTVLEANSQVGGLARTINYKGYLFDVGGHRFFTRVRLIEELWREVLGPDLLVRERLSRIYYRGRFFRYPLEPIDTLRQLGLVEALRCSLSYAWAQLHRIRPERDLATWIRNRFGQRLFEIFFKTYTEKVWGMACEQIDAAWAAQRIRGLSLSKAILNAWLRRESSGGSKTPRTLIQQFYYPRRGPGMLWERMAEKIEELGGTVLCNSPAETIRWRDGRVLGVVAGGKWWPADYVISSIPLRDLFLCLEPPAPAEFRQAALQLQYRDFLTVALIYRQPNLFPDNWIYVHQPTVRVARIQNYKNWSPEMVPDPSTSCIGLEYFCNAGDELWRLDDTALIRLAATETEQLKLAQREDLLDGAVLRVEKAYPVYDRTYRQNLDRVREFLSQFGNLQVIGRNGMHRYNNQDHSMLTGLLAARNVVQPRYDVWRVNEAWEYLEEGLEIDPEEFVQLQRTQPLVPEPLS